MTTTPVRYSLFESPMPLSMAARTSSHPPVWQTAWPVATSTSTNTASRRPCRYVVRRLSPLRWLCRTCLVSEQRREVPAQRGQFLGRALLDELAVPQHDRPVRERPRR